MEDHPEDKIDVRAMKWAKCFYEKKGWRVTDVARRRNEHSGYDLFLEKGSEQRMVEVKGCSTLYGIPDLHHNEFIADANGSLRLVADELCVVYFLPDGQRKRAIIPREEIPPEFVVTLRPSYRISGKFKNAKEMDEFIEEID
jgi:hypothetical protein